MLEITQHAASVIAEECSAREVPETGGLRIAPKTSADNGNVRSLVIEFVARPRSSDTVLHEGDATVFLADGVAPVIGSRILDAEESGTPPRLVLRSRASA
jgi:Fe-S cluster assembly iron-binding protein IscA